MFSLQHAASLATLWLLITFSVITWTIIVVKAGHQWRLTKQNRQFHQAFWRAKDLQAAVQALKDAPGPLAHVCRTGSGVMEEMRRANDGDLQHSGDLRETLERTLRQEVQNLQGTLDSGLMPLASIGSTAPFVGLFGTVWGIMHALQDIGQSGSAGLDVVAGPIGEALIATALGIATAVPAVLAYNYFLRRLRVNVAQLENFATDFLHLGMKSDLKRQKGGTDGRSN